MRGPAGLAPTDFNNNPCQTGSSSDACKQFLYPDLCKRGANQARCDKFVQANPCTQNAAGDGCKYFLGSICRTDPVSDQCFLLRGGMVLDPDPCRTDPQSSPCQTYTTQECALFGFASGQLDCSYFSWLLRMRPNDSSNCDSLLVSGNLTGALNGTACQTVLATTAYICSLSEPALACPVTYGGSEEALGFPGAHNTSVVSSHGGSGSSGNSGAGGLIPTARGASGATGRNGTNLTLSRAGGANKGNGKSGKNKKGPLPRTGLDVPAVFLIGLLLIAAGTALRRRTLLLVPIAATVAIGLAATAQAQTGPAVEVNPNTMSWPFRTITFYPPRKPLPPQFAGGEQVLQPGAVRDAIEAWNAKLGADGYHLVPDDTVTKGVPNANLVFVTRSHTSPQCDGQTIDGFNLSQQDIALNGHCDRYIAHLVAAHEIGHVFGLAHEQHVCAVMNPGGFAGPKGYPKLARPRQCPLGANKQYWKHPVTDADARGALAAYNRPVKLRDNFCYRNGDPHTPYPTIFSGICTIAFDCRGVQEQFDNRDQGYSKPCLALQAPWSVTPIAGSVRSGYWGSLGAPDGDRWQMDSDSSATPTTDWYGAFPMLSGTSLKSLRVTYRGMNSTDCTQRLGIWNPHVGNGTWVPIDQAVVGQTETRRDAYPPGDPATYVAPQGNSAYIFVRVQCTAATAFYTSADQLQIAYTLDASEAEAGSSVLKQGLQAYMLSPRRPRKG